jgi:hypothetical protein
MAKRSPKPTGARPPLREIEREVPRHGKGRVAILSRHASREAREDLLTYMGAAAARLVDYSVSTWVRVRLPLFQTVPPMTVRGVQMWIDCDPEAKALKHRILGGEANDVTTLWEQRGREAWAE